jgi:hypothetical protein
MPREPNKPPPPPPSLLGNAAQQGATQRNKQKNTCGGADHYPVHSNELSQRQRAAIELLLRGFSDAQTAAEVGVDRGTIYRWRTDDPEFAHVLETQRRILWQQSAQRLQTMYQPALDILEKQLTGADPRLALRAAALLLRVATPARLDRITRDPATAVPTSTAPRAFKKSPAGHPQSADDAFAALLDAYINAPLPGELGRQVEANASKLPAIEEEEDDDDDLDDECDNENDRS